MFKKYAMFVHSTTVIFYYLGILYCTKYFNFYFSVLIKIKKFIKINCSVIINIRKFQNKFKILLVKVYSK